MPVCYCTVKYFSQYTISSDSAFCSRMSSSIGVRARADHHWIYLILYTLEPHCYCSPAQIHTLIHACYRIDTKDLVYTASDVGLTAFTTQTFAVSITWIYNFSIFFNINSSQHHSIVCFTSLEKKEDVACTNKINRNNQYKISLTIRRSKKDLKKSQKEFAIMIPYCYFRIK